MLTPTPWRPLLDARTDHQRRLEAAIRIALPCKEKNTVAHGERRWEQMEMTPGQVQIRRLEWHLRGRGEVEKRAVEHWTFRGEAGLSDTLIDFYGECLRDASTGAYREFGLHLVA